MKNDFKNSFNNFVEENTLKQLQIIDDICSKYNLDPTNWWKKYISDSNERTGLSFFNDLLIDFIYHLSVDINSMLLEYIPKSGDNYKGKPYLYSGLSSLEYDGFKFTLPISDTKLFQETISKLKLSQKIKLLENKLFSDIIKQTNIELLSKKDIRVLKIEKINKRKYVYTRY